MDATTPPYELPQEGPQPFLRLPWAVGALAGVMLAIQAVLSAMPSLTDRIFFNYGFVPARYSPSFLAAHGLDAGSLLDRILPFFTYMFLHAGWMHVIVNTVWLLAFGAAVVRRFGNLRFFLFFIICGVLGAALHLALNWQSIAPVVGASAAISGLMAAAFRLIGHEGGGGIPPQRLAPIFSRRILLWSAIWVVINIAAGVTGLGAGPGAQFIAWQAHLGGYIAGLFLAGLFDPVNRLNPEPL
jgi:membrane associated rhomboid family serine protease